MASREQEHTRLPMPNGWFAVDWSHQLREGDVKPLHYFGEELVLFRTRSGGTYDVVLRGPEDRTIAYFRGRVHEVGGSFLGADR